MASRRVAIRDKLRSDDRVKCGGGLPQRASSRRRPSRSSVVKWLLNAGMLIGSAALGSEGVITG